MASKECKDATIQLLKQITESIDDIYYATRDELEEDILHRKEKIEKADKETNDIYNVLTEKTCIKLIKKKLPLRIRLFNKISWQGQGIKGSGLILICFAFNEKFDQCFEYVFRTEEVKKILKIK